jgi:hypothetical protein
MRKSRFLWTLLICLPVLIGLIAAGGEEKKPAKKSKSPKFKYIGAAGCKTCHRTKKQGQGLIAMGREALQQAEDAFEKMAPGPQKEEAEKLLADARHNLELVIRANPVHNIFYAESVVDNVCSNAETVKELAAENPATEEEQPPADATPDPEPPAPD